MLGKSIKERGENGKASQINERESESQGGTGDMPMFVDHTSSSQISPCSNPSPADAISLINTTWWSDDDLFNSAITSFRGLDRTEHAPDIQTLTTDRSRPASTGGSDYWSYNGSPGGTEEQVLSSQATSASPLLPCMDQIQDVSSDWVRTAEWSQSVIGLDSQTPPVGRTPLHQAAAHGHEDVVYILLKNCANPHFIDSNGQTILHLAAENGHQNILRLALRYGVDIDACDNGGKTALHLAAENGQQKITEVLIQAGANINARAAT
jgi:hypothetical protein